MNGVLLIDKPAGPTSHDLVAFLRRLLRMKKIGHAGTLDPFATGLLVMMIGRATKLSSYLMDRDKVYRATVKWGEKTDTLDPTGRLVAACDRPLPERPAIEAACRRHEGITTQAPPMYSAKKLNGKPLYRLARRGMETPRPAKPVRIDRITVTAVDPEARTFSFRVHCSKGTYIRVLADNLAETLGGVGHLAALTREASGPLSLDQALTPAQAEQLHAAGALAERLLGPDDILRDLPAVTLSDDAGRFLRHGRRPVPAGIVAADDYAKDQAVRLLDRGGKLVALARALAGLGDTSGGSIIFPFQIMLVFPGENGAEG